VKIRRLELDDIGPFEMLRLEFNQGFNLICGPNGVGKSTILAAIVEPFGGGYGGQLKRRAASSIGRWYVTATHDLEPYTAEKTVSAIKPNDREPDSQLQSLATNLIHIRIGRDLTYQELTAIPADPKPDIGRSLAGSQQGINNTDLKGWLAQRWIFSQLSDTLNSVQLRNFECAKRAFTALSPLVSLLTVQPGVLEILVRTPDGDLPFEYLSTGYKSSLYIILGIIKEIEIRQLHVSADDFDGCVLIDEIDLHLHPTWQQAIVPALKATFPKAQFIATTHSPHVVQIAAAGEVIALSQQETGAIVVSTFNDTPFGFAGWSVEEILTDVMGLKDTYTPIFRQTMDAFDLAIEREDSVEAERSLNDLYQMLHPTSYLRKVVSIEAAGVVDNERFVDGD
jgi:energy-coupling factor transporter ATP-binding protein EcfA2